MANRAIEESAGDDQTRAASADAEGRDSGIVEVERKASAVTGGVTSAAASLPTSTDEITGTREAPKTAAHEIEIETELPEASGPRAQMITQTNEITHGVSSSAVSSSAVSSSAVSSNGVFSSGVSSQSNGAGGASSAAADDSEDDAIPVSDDEIESAEPLRPTLTSGLQAFSRSRPPARPSLRPRSSNGTSLPPPRSSRVGGLLGNSLPPPGFPSQFPSGRPPASERDPWLLANKTLELSRANARIAALEDQLAFRDARILTLEERLESAQQRIAELEAKLELAPAARPAPKPGALLSTPAAASKVGSPSRPASSTKQVSIPKPSDVSKPPSSRTPLSAVFGSSPASSNGPATVASHSREAEASTPAAPPVAAAAKTATAAGAQQPDDDAAEVVGESVPPPPELVAELAASRAADGPEDLQRIAGIGPRFEAALRKQGITRVSQIASWSEADIRQVAKALKIPKSRIIKGRWVETARELSK